MDCYKSVTILWKSYRALRECYGTLLNVIETLRTTVERYVTLCSVMDALRNVTEVLCYGTLRNVMELLQNFAERYRTLRCVAGRYGMLWNVTDALQKRCRVLWNITEHYGALQDVMGCCGSVVDRYCSVTKPLWNCYGKYRCCTTLIKF